MFWSAVMRTSKPSASAAAIRSPFDIPAQPISKAGVTWCPTIRRLRAVGRFSSSRMRSMLSGVCDHSTRTLKPDTWEHVALKLLRCYASVDIIDNALGEDAGVFHDPLAGNAAWHAFNVGAVR